VVRPAGPLHGAHPAGRVAGVAAGEAVEAHFLYDLAGRVQGKGVRFPALVGQRHQAALAVVGEAHVLPGLAAHGQAVDGRVGKRDFLPAVVGPHDVALPVVGEAGFAAVGPTHGHQLPLAVVAAALLAGPARR
jgi:hypothetical protein